MSVNLISLKTFDLKKKQIFEIIKLKNSHWKTGLKKQLEWFRKNIKKDDIHNIIYLNRKMIGYNCLRNRKFKINKNYKSYLLFDTIVIQKRFRSRQFGKKFMELNNGIINKKKKISILLCTSSKVNFYKKNNWKILNLKKKILVTFNHKKKLVMIYNKKIFPKKDYSNIIFN